MKIYRISKCRFINDLSGTGAALYGGRWNSKGNYALYTAETPSLALLESVVHISNIPATSYCMITLEIPDTKITEIKIDALPKNWQQQPPPDALKKFGDRFIAESKFLALKIPSVIIPEESNYLINPKHTDFKKIKLLSNRPISIDERLMKK